MQNKNKQSKIIQLEIYADYSNPKYENISVQKENAFKEWRKQENNDITFTEYLKQNNLHDIPQWKEC